MDGKNGPAQPNFSVVPEYGVNRHQTEVVDAGHNFFSGKLTIDKKARGRIVCEHINKGSRFVVRQGPQRWQGDMACQGRRAVLALHYSRQ